MAMDRRQSTQTISWFRDLNVRGLLDLEPPYQRRSVWNQTFKDYFIDTILLGYPAPAIFLYEEISPEGSSKYNVVDGKQRLTTIFEFADGAFPVSEKAIVTRLRGKYFAELEDEDKTSFWTYQFSVEYLPTNDEDPLNSIFDRINRNVAKLSPQELRHAAYSGEFISSAEEMAAWMGARLPSDLPRIVESSRSQMRDIELVSQLLLAVENGPASSSQAALDSVTAERDETWPDRQEVERRFQATVEAIAPVARAIAGANHRLKNQVDFYSWFAAVAELLAQGQAVPSATMARNRLDAFFAVVADEAQRDADTRARDYYEAARSNSNGTAERRRRTTIIREILTGQ